ncbi:conserved hypothetical protein, partial [Ricinus communis]
MNIGQFLDQRDLREIIHFTTNRGLIGILASNALKSRKRLHEDQYLRYILHVNARIRPEESDYFDKQEDWLDYVNLTFSEINRRFFDFSQNWHNPDEIWWAILSFDSEICQHPGVYFATTNNGYDHCLRDQGLTGLQDLFDSPIRRKPGWVAHRGSREGHLTT